MIITMMISAAIAIDYNDDDDDDDDDVGMGTDVMTIGYYNGDGHGGH